MYSLWVLLLIGFLNYRRLSTIEVPYVTMTQTSKEMILVEKFVGKVRSKDDESFAY